MTFMSAIFDKCREMWGEVDAAATTIPWWVIALFSLIIGNLIQRLYTGHKLRGPLYKRVAYCILHLIEAIPFFVKGYITGVLAEAQRDITKDVHKNDTSEDWIRELPEEGMQVGRVLENLEKYTTREDNGRLKREVPDYLGGMVSGAVFNLERNEEESKLVSAVFAKTAYSNPLWPAFFPQIRRMEAEVVEMTKQLLNGGSEVCGTMTSGGSMSIIQACLAYRNRAFERGVDFPEMILPASAHAAFYKSAKMFGMIIREIPVENTKYVVDPKKVKAAINGSTCMIVGSVPNYPYGTCDNIEALGKIALRAKVPLHVDACCGGFLLPFFDQNDVPAFDFRVPGVTSISADTHKYGLAPKGSSVILFSSDEYRRHSFYKNVNWCGGIYASPSIEGSRNGSAIAVTWASLLFNGKVTLRESAANVRRVTRELRDKIAKLPGMELMGRGDVCIVAWRNNLVDDYKLLDLLGKKNYVISPLQFPKCAHLMVTPLHSGPGFVDGLIEAMREGIQELLDNPTLKTDGAAAMYGMTIACPDRTLVSDVANMYLKTLYTFPPAKSSYSGEENQITTERARKIFDDYMKEEESVDEQKSRSSSVTISIEEPKQEREALLG